MSDATTEQKRAPRPFRPFPSRLTDEVRKHVDTLMAAVWPWVSKRRERVEESTTALVNNDDAELRAHLADALMVAAQAGGPITWDGFLVAYELRAKHGWPADGWLVSVISKWSCEVNAKGWEAYRARKAKGAAP